MEEGNIMALLEQILEENAKFTDLRHHYRKAICTAMTK